MYFQILKIHIDIVTPVFFLILLGYYVGPHLAMDPRTLSITAYFLLVPCFVFDIISKVDIEITKAGQMILYAKICYHCCFIHYNATPCYIDHFALSCIIA